MKATEIQQKSSPPHDAAAQASDGPSTSGEKFKKPHLKLFNCLMKPSLSLTSLPPQSPKETSDETQLVERPYNSLKVRFLDLLPHEYLMNFFVCCRKSAMAKKNSGGARGNRRLPLAQQPRTPERAAAEMEMISGRRIISLWTQISSIRAVKQPAKRTKQEAKLRENSKLLKTMETKW